MTPKDFRQRLIISAVAGLLAWRPITGQADIEGLAGEAIKISDAVLRQLKRHKIKHRLSNILAMPTPKP
jgi:hypothetical protein